MINRSKYSLIFFCLMLFLSSCGKKKYESNDLLMEKAISCGENGDWSKAQLLANKATNQNGFDSNARIMLALSLEQLGQHERALEEATQAVVIDQNNFMAQYTKGRLLFNQMRYEDCPAPLGKAYELNKNMSQPILLLARTNALLDIRKEAIKYYIALAKHDDYKGKSEPYNELGVLFMNKGDFKRALRFFEEAYLKDKNSIPVNLNLAIFWDELSLKYINDDAKAKKASDRAIKFYITSEKLLLVNPKASGKRKKILQRIKELKAIYING